MTLKAGNGWRLEEMGPAIVVDLTIKEYSEILTQIYNYPSRKLTYPLETYQKVFHELVHYFQVISSASGVFQHFLLQIKKWELSTNYEKNVKNMHLLGKIERPAYEWISKPSLDDDYEFLKEFVKKNYKRGSSCDEYHIEKLSPKDIVYLTVSGLKRTDALLHSLRYCRSAQIVGDNSRYWFSVAYKNEMKKIYQDDLLGYESAMYAFTKTQKLEMEVKEMVEKDSDRDMPSVWSIIESFSTEITLDTMINITRLGKEDGTFNEDKIKRSIQELKSERTNNEAFFLTFIEDADIFSDYAIKDIQLAICEVSLMGFNIAWMFSKVYKIDLTKGIYPHIRYKLLIEFVKQKNIELVKHYEKNKSFEALCDCFTQHLDGNNYRKSIKHLIKVCAISYRNWSFLFSHGDYMLISHQMKEVKCMKKYENVSSKNGIELFKILVDEGVDIVAICKDGCFSTKFGPCTSLTDSMGVRTGIMEEKIMDDFCNRRDFESSRELFSRMYPNNQNGFSDVIKDSWIYPLIVNSEPALNDDFSISS